MELKRKSRFRTVMAMYHSIDGIKVLWQREEAFRTEVYLSIILIPCLFLVEAPSLVKLVLILLLLLVLVVETINSALEAVIDRISSEIHPQSKVVKDIGSAAVGLTLLMNLIAWVYLIFLKFYP